MQLRAKLIILSALLLATSLAKADIYVGMFVGNTEYPQHNDQVNSFELSAGYRFNNYLAAEFSWLDFGETGVRGSRSTYNYFAIDGTGLAILTFLPLSDDFDVFWKLGLYSWEIESSSITAKAQFRSKSQGTDTDLLVGAGLTWNLSDNFALRGQYQELDVQGDNISNVSIGATYSF